MSKLVAFKNETEYDLPLYSTPGNITVEILNDFGPKFAKEYVYRYEIDRYSYDNGACPFWVNEGIGIDFFVDMKSPPEITGPGFYTFVNVVGYYTKGDWGFTDDDEDFEYELCRIATQEEVDSL
jgi:hypothetical protein